MPLKQQINNNQPSPNDDEQYYDQPSLPVEEGTSANNINDAENTAANFIPASIAEIKKLSDFIDFHYDKVRYSLSSKRCSRSCKHCETLFAASVAKTDYLVKHIIQECCLIESEHKFQSQQIIIKLQNTQDSQTIPLEPFVVISSTATGKAKAMYSGGSSVPAYPPRRVGGPPGQPPI